MAVCTHFLNCSAHILLYTACIYTPSTNAICLEKGRCPAQAQQGQRGAHPMDHWEGAGMSRRAGGAAHAQAREGLGWAALGSHQPQAGHPAPGEACLTAGCPGAPRLAAAPPGLPSARGCPSAPTSALACCTPWWPGCLQKSCLLPPLAWTAISAAHAPAAHPPALIRMRLS